MAKYSNVDVNSLVSFVNNAIRELNSHNLVNIRRELSVKNVIQSSANLKVTTSLKNVSDYRNFSGSIPNLRNVLNTLKSVTEYIKKYQSVEEEIRILERELDNASDMAKSYIRTRLNSKRSTLRMYEQRIDSMLTR